MRSFITCCLLSISLAMARPEGGHHDLVHHVPPGHLDDGHHGLQHKSFGGHHDIGHNSISHHGGGEYEAPRHGGLHHGGGGYDDHNDHHHGSGQYGFEYAVQDPHYGGNFGHVEQRDGYVTKGSYFVDLPDGRRQTVTYTADEYGYHPVVTYDGEAHYDDAHHGGGGYGGHGGSHHGGHGESHLGGHGGSHHGGHGVHHSVSQEVHHGIGPVYH